MKQLVYGGILMITGMLGIIVSLMLAFVSFTDIRVHRYRSLSPSSASFCLRLWSFSAIMSTFVRR